MKLQDYKLIFIAVGLIGLLLIATPTFSMVWHPSPGEEYSDLYILGPNHEMGNYPFNVVADMNYSFNVGVSNYLASSAYYVLYVKLGNVTELPTDKPGSTTGSPSTLTPLYELRDFLQTGDSFDMPLTFSISDVSLSSNQCLIKTFEINGITSNVNKAVAWDTVHQGFYYELIIELWIYNGQSNAIEYDSRCVNLPLNVTSTALA